MMPFPRPRRMERGIKLVRDLYPAALRMRRQEAIEYFEGNLVKVAETQRATTASAEVEVRRQQAIAHLRTLAVFVEAARSWPPE
jgi:hypothetical protein